MCNNDRLVGYVIYDYVTFYHKVDSKEGVTLPLKQRMLSSSVNSKRECNTTIRLRYEHYLLLHSIAAMIVLMSPITDQT
jgi:hypothetical protein